MPDPHTERLLSEFGRTARFFVERTRGRFDSLGIIEFAGVQSDEAVLEVGAGTGNFLQLFRGHAARLIALDLSEAMLREAERQFDDMDLVLADGARLPFASHSIELVATAQALHHIPDPLPLLREMRRVMSEAGRLLVVDQVAPERYEEAVAMDELEVLRDPSHAATRPPSAMRMLIRAAGFEPLEERLVDGEQTMSDWMAPGEFPPERAEAVLSFIDERGRETGMDFRKKGGEYAFTRRRMLVLARRA